MKQQALTIENAPMSFWAGLGFFVSVCLFILVGGWMVVGQMMEDKASPVTSLIIRGDIQYTHNFEIVNTLKQGELDNFFQLDVNQVQQQLESLPWVYSASVRKQWPNEVRIYVNDQRPVAQWNDDFFINEHGVIFQAEKSRVSHALPKLYGPEGSEVLALENYRNLSNLLTFIQVEINELVLTERYAWQLTLADGVFLRLGREDRVMRVQRFMESYPEIKAFAKENMKVDYVDLRYDTGMAVGWKPVEEKQQEQNTNA